MPSTTPVFSEDSIRPKDVMAGHSAGFERDVEWLSERQDRFVDVPCPACGHRNFTFLYEKNRTKHNACNNCGTQFVTPRASRDLLEEFYRNSQNAKYWAEVIYPVAMEGRRKNLYHPRAQHLHEIAVSWGQKGGVLLEVGAGMGTFLEEMLKFAHFDKLWGLEPGLDSATRDLGEGLTLIDSSFEHFTASEPCDFIVAYEVIEHLYDPDQFVAWAHKNLKVGGGVLVSTPNIAGLETSVLGKKSTTVDHQHINLFTPQSLGLLFRRHGFELVSSETPGSLDLVLLGRALAEGRIEKEDVPEFLVNLLDKGSEEEMASFQKLLRSLNWSSHQRLVARKR